MSLSKSSVLFGWSSRYGMSPRIGGRPVFSRNTSGLFTAQENEVTTSIVNTPRFDWMTLNLPNSQTERRKVLTLELARTNSLFPARDLSNAGWTKTNMTAALSDTGADGTPSTATRLTATAANATVSQQFTLASSQRFQTAYVRRITGSGVIQMTTDAGAADWQTIAVTSDWQRFSIPTKAVVNPNCGFKIVTSGDAIAVDYLDNETGSFATAPIPTTTVAATRAQDIHYWNFLPLPQGMMGYVRFIEQGTLSLGGATRIFQIGGSANTTPYVVLYATSGLYNLIHDNGTVSRNIAGGAANIGDTVELLFIVYADGNVELIQSVNGGAAVTSGATATGGLAFASAWSGERLWLNSVSTSFVGAGKFADVKIVKYADVAGLTAADRMTELRAFELAPNGDVL